MIRFRLGNEMREESRVRGEVNGYIEFIEKGREIDEEEIRKDYESTMQCE